MEVETKMNTALWIAAIFFALCAPPSTAEQGKRASRLASDVGMLRGQIGAIQKNGAVVPATSATVYVMYASGINGRSFTHHAATDTAGGTFTYKLHELLGPVNKQVKKLANAGQTDEIARLYLAALDEAIAATTDWVTNHPDKAWQVRTIAPDADGFWSAEGLNPGSYAIVARGVIAGHDADWEGTVDLAPGRTISMPLTSPRFSRS